MATTDAETPGEEQVERSVADEASGPRRRRRRIVIAASVVVGALIAGAIVAAALTSDDGARSGAVGATPTIREFSGLPELVYGNPRFYVGFDGLRASKAEVNIKVTWGCIGFGDQTKSYILVNDWPRILVYDDGYAYATWDPGSSIFTNICDGSKYAARVRVLKDGAWTAWSPWVNITL